MFSLALALIFLFDREVFGKPATDPELQSEYFQGDIIGVPFRSRNGISNAIFHWPNGIVQYVIEDNDFGEAHRREILRAISIIEAKSCVVFKPATAEERSKALVITSKGAGCNSVYLGFRNRVQIVNLQIYPLGEGCFRIGSIIHELLHVLGFEHQHVASNRNEYVRIKWENINPEYKINFVNEDKSTSWHDFGEGYDYESVMHYIPKAFSKNGLPTIEPLKEGATNMGQRLYMSEKDIRKLNKMYKCPGYV
ncbi:seminal metalloprotease 1 [Drosophila takahashii]|uniref:seminal metalloprotease 1 n=1 Tax=Drosophila takahashii TaxID=29030 RepID=UPI001CF86114|nr:seminal metalloprotease 1 [Drosophila takahashii]